MMRAKAVVSAIRSNGFLPRRLCLRAGILWLALCTATLNLHAWGAQPVDGDAPDEQAGQQQPSIEERLDALLEEALPKDEYREVSQCLRRHKYRHVEVLDDQHLLFRKSDRFWLNELKLPCVGLHRDLVMTFDTRGTSSLCNGDRVYLSSSFDMNRGFDATGRPIALQGICILGSYETITPEQAAIIRRVNE